MTPLPIVITSINPFAKLDHQLRCFKAWKAVGFDVRTANVAKEADILKQAGLTDDDIIMLKAKETGQALFGKPVPKIKAVLVRAHALAKGEVPVLLVNSDLYPALRGVGVAAFWGSLGSVVALTREDCMIVETYNFVDKQPYRGGLDAFFIHADALGDVIQKLQEMAVAERMCFGIPGWDYMMGAIALSPQFGGRILDSGLLLHEIHRNTYSNVDEFAHYLPDMAALSGITTESPARGAEAFSRIIKQACAAEDRQTALAKMMFFTPVAGRGEITADAYQISQRLLPCAPFTAWHGSQTHIALFANRMLSGNSRDFPRVISFFVVNPDPQFRFNQVLVAILFSLLCQIQVKAGKPTSVYPEGNLHAAAVQNILDRYKPGSGYRRLEFAQLFGAELIEHRIFNPRLYNYLVLCCETELERNLITEISTAVRRLANAA